MGASISEQTLVFLAMCICGAAVGVLFDIFRSFRLAVRPSEKAVHISDFLFCVFAALVFFWGIVRFNNGQLRWYVFLGAVLGAVIYFLTISSYMIKLFIFVGKGTYKIFKLILKILLTPIKFLYTILIVPIYKILRKLCGKIKAFAFRLTRGAQKAVTKEISRRKKKKSRVLTFLFVGILGFMFVRGVMQQPQITKNKQKAAELQAQIDYEEKRMEEVDALKGKVNTDEYIEKVAQEKLGLVKREAKIFIDASDK
jgi:spore cortex biosynthesis protein YabQ